jgi:hypothetical protein
VRLGEKRHTESMYEWDIVSLYKHTSQLKVQLRSHTLLSQSHFHSPHTLFHLPHIPTLLLFIYSITHLKLYNKGREKGKGKSGGRTSVRLFMKMSCQLLRVAGYFFFAFFHKGLVRVNNREKSWNTQSQDGKYNYIHLHSLFLIC